METLKEQFEQILKADGLTSSPARIIYTVKKMQQAYDLGRESRNGELEDYKSEHRAEQNSIAAGAAEDEMKEKLIAKISDMVYDCVPTGEVTAWELIGVIKKLKSDIENL